MLSQTVKQQCKRERVKVKKRTQLRRFREARREVSGSDGLGGILGRQDTKQQGERRRKEPFWVLRANSPKKCKKTCSPGGSL
jgi:hypothetical protein